MSKKVIAILSAAILCAAILSSCAGCNESPYVPHAHNYVQYATEPTCLKQGYTLHVCECGSKYADSYVEPLGHSFTENTCNRCGYVRHDHVYEITVIEPTCTEGGYTTGKCLYCSASYTADFTNALGHDYVDGRCTRCPSENATDGLQFELSADKSYYICSGIGTAKATALIIPSVYKGKPVTAIGEKAFKNFYLLEGIQLPSSLKIIGAYAFSGCKALTNIVIPDGVTNIESYAFNACTNLTSVTISDSVISIGYFAFTGCSALKSVKLPNGITAIKPFTFSRCVALTDITIPDGVTAINSDAFRHCNSLTSINLPNSVTTIENYAFGDCENLKGIIIPDSVTFIGSGAFINCTQLKAVIIPNSVTKIDYGTFKGCDSLKNINFNGTKAQWSAILKDTDLEQFNIICTDGTIKQTVINEPFTATLKFTETDEGYECTGIGTVISDPIVIPSSLNGKHVTSIGDYAFSGNLAIDKVFINYGVKRIGEYAFHNSGLIDITIPDSVTSIGNYAFYGCKNLKSITLPREIKRLSGYTFTSSGITDIYFGGTKEEWKAIPHTDWLYFSNDCTVHCTDGDTVILRNVIY